MRAGRFVGHTGAVTGPAGRQHATGSAAAAVGLVGIAAIVGGTFAPWVNSGSVGRDLYRVTGIASRIGLLGPDSPAASLLPLLGPVCVIPVLVFVLRARRTAAVLALVLALACGGFAAAAMILAAGQSVVGVSLARTGPVIVVVGAALVVVAAVTLLAAARSGGRAGKQESEIGTTPLGDPSH